MSAPSELSRLRPSTMAKTESIYGAAGAGSSSRKILPIEETPSIVVDASLGREINIEATRIKTSEKLITFFTDNILQADLECQTTRGKTDLQGSQAPRGFQAAHYSLDPNLLDDSLDRIEERVISVGVTPKKSAPFLRARLRDFNTPEKKLLDSQHTDKTFVHTFIRERILSREAASAIAGTHYEKRRNATFENPDESNQFDCLLEAYIRPISDDLKKRNANKEIDAEEATRRLVGHMLQFYRESIANLQKRLGLLKEFHALETRIIAFENSYGPNDDITFDLLQTYLGDVKQLLELKRDFLSKQTGVHCWRDVRERRSDFYHLNRLVNYLPETSQADLIQRYKGFRPYLQTPALEEISAHLLHYQLCLTEAQAQQQETLLFENAAAIDNLRALIFGINDRGSRRPPSPEELHSQVLDMLKFSPIKSHPRKRHEREAEDETAMPTSKARRTIKFQDSPFHPPLQDLTNKFTFEFPASKLF